MKTRKVWKSTSILRGAATMAAVASVFIGAVGSAPMDHAAMASNMKTLVLFSDTSGQFVSPAEPAFNQPYQISIEATAGQLKSASLVFAGSTYPMKKVAEDGVFDRYSATVPGQTWPQPYDFEVVTVNGQTLYDSETGISSLSPSLAQTFTVTPGFQTPSWATGAVIYQIFPDRFYNGDPTNDDVTNEFMYDGFPDVHVSNWNKAPDATPYSLGGNRTREFYGGDLQGVIDKLSYLKNLGIQAIYLNPVFVAPSNHKYDTQDFSHVDPHLGKIVADGGKTVNPALGMLANLAATKYKVRTENPKNLAASDAVLQRLITDAHKMGIKVMLDGVFEDTGTFNKWFDAQHLYPNQAPNGPGAYEAKNSPFHAFYNFNNSSWPNNDSYDAFMGISDLPKLNYENAPKLVNIMDGIAKKWISPPYNADGWRLDSPYNLGYSQTEYVKFWDQFRTAAKQANPNAFILGEWYSDPTPVLDGRGFDTIQNYPEFTTPVSNLLTGLDDYSGAVSSGAKGSVTHFLNTIETQLALFPSQSLYTAMNSLDNQDTSRFLTRTNGVVGSDDNGKTSAQAGSGIHDNVLEQGVLMEMTWPGDPTIYYGDEAGVVGWTDPDSRRTFPWGHENQTLESFYRNIIHVHTSTSALMHGSLYLFPATKPHVLSYGRFDASSAAITVVNLGQQTEQVTIPSWQLDVVNGVKWKMDTVVNGSSSMQGVVQQSGQVTVTVPAQGGLLLTAKKSSAP